MKNSFSHYPYTFQFKFLVNLVTDYLVKLYTKFRSFLGNNVGSNERPTKLTNFFAACKNTCKERDLPFEFDKEPSDFVGTDNDFYISSPDTVVEDTE